MAVALEALENILKVGACDMQEGGAGAANIYAHLVDEAEGLEKIETLQHHPNNDIYEKAVKIMEAYFGLEDEEDQNLAPELDSTGTAYSFGGGGTPAPGRAAAGIIGRFARTPEQPQLSTVPHENPRTTHTSGPGMRQAQSPHNCWRF